MSGDSCAVMEPDDGSGPGPGGDGTSSPVSPQQVGSSGNYDKNKVDLYRIARILVLGEQRERIPEYVRVMFNEYCLKKKRVEVELTAFNDEHHRLKPLFVDRRTNNLILVD